MRLDEVKVERILQNESMARVKIYSNDKKQQVGKRGLFSSELGAVKKGKYWKWWSQEVSSHLSPPPPSSINPTLYIYLTASA